MADKLLTKQDLIERWGISESQFEKMKHRNELPKAVVISDRIHRWKESIVEEWELERT